MPRHNYSCLNEAAGEIRLVDILPGTKGSETVIELHTTHLRQDEPAPSFEALSYAWGSARDTVEVQVGDHKDGSLSITRNLSIALQHLRLPHRSRTFWIDAICVDQDNLQERGQQVKRMADIYTKAERVVVWLGPEGSNTALAMEALATLSTKIQANWSLWTTEPAPGILASENHWADPGSALPFDVDTIAGIQELYGRDWFQRLWVQQEIRFANDGALVMCGHESILFTHIRKAALCLYNKLGLDSKTQKDRLSLVWSMGELGYTTLPGIVSLTRHCHCSDPKDRIFAVLSFLQKYEKRLVITPDYDKTVQTIYQDTSWQWIQHNSKPDIMALCDGTSVAAGLPSWVPNFASPLKSNLLQAIFTASARTSCVAVSSGGVLTLEGITVAIIEKTIAWQENQTITDIICRLAPLNMTLRLHDNDGGSLLDAFCSTLNGGLFSNSYIPEDTTSPNFERFREIVKQVLDPEFNVSQLSNSASKVLENAELYLRGRTFFNTDTGNIGLAPLAAEAGDHVVILLGGRTAFVLRPSGTAGHFQIIGESYLHGYMHGEALLGPLPSQVRSVSCYNPKTGGYRVCYQDIESGVCEVEDPRLGPLPFGWRKINHNGDGDKSWYVNDTIEGTLDDKMSGKGHVDPRLMPGILRAQGVKLRTFDLV